MATITASMVKELREKTGAGMMDCKAALTESGAEMEAAVDWLRTKGLAKAAKKAGRVASEGLIGLKVEGSRGAMVEVNSETDFVARNDQFQTMVGTIAAQALKAGGDPQKLTRMTYPGTKQTVEDRIKEMIATIGENMGLRRAAEIGVKKGVVASYMHSSVQPDLGKIGVLVAIESTGDADKLTALGRQIAMHVAASNPLAVTAEELDPQVIERERSVLREQAKESGKPAAVIEKMVEGRLRKFYEDVVLLAQPFVIDPEKTVEQAVKEAAAEVGKPIKVAGFVRFALGEGIEKGEGDDFAAEVAAMSSR